MEASIKNGLNKEGVLPGGLKLPRKAQSLFIKGQNFATPFKRRSQLFSYALELLLLIFISQKFIYFYVVKLMHEIFHSNSIFFIN